MKIKFLQHVSFENAANIESWALSRSNSISSIRVYENEPFVGVDEFDMLAVMGGPMNIYEYDKHPWLTSEKQFIEETIKAGKLVIGVCLGAQLIADVLGAKVYKNKESEIGWFNVSLTKEAEQSRIFSGSEKEFPVFQWHGDTFSIPVGARPLAKSIACANQAFEYNDGRVLALQFHLETTQTSMNALLENCADEIKPDCAFIQSAEQIKDLAPEYLPKIESKMTAMLDAMVRSSGE